MPSLPESAPRNPKSILLLFGIGTSTLGDFIYLVAINVLILKLTDSAAAVAGLWIMGPLASIITKFWSGSVIDRMEKRKLMIGADLFRAVLVTLIPFFTSVWPIYICLFFLSVAKAFFAPASMTYITMLIPRERRKKFNSFQSLITSGAVLVGPAVAGGLLVVSSTETAIWINASSFLISAIILFLLPDLDKKNEASSQPSESLGFHVLRSDWQQVIKFIQTHKFIATVYFLAQFVVIIALGMDAQEVVFTQKVLGLSESEYGLLISIAGIGSVVGAATLSMMSIRLSIKAMIGTGVVMVAIGYLIYGFSFSFLSVAIGFILIGYFDTFSNAGSMTFFQNNVPTNMMGRLTSVFGTFQSVLQIIFILLIGFTGDILPLRYSIIAASLLYLGLSLILMVMVLQPSRQSYFIEAEETDSL